MTAGLFAHHGVWVGPCHPGNPRNAKGYFESVPFKRALLEKFGRLGQLSRLAEELPGWREEALRILHANGYDGGPWLVKHSVMYYRAWHEFKPQFICVRRKLESVRRSGVDTGFFTNSPALELHAEALDHVRDNLGGVDVFTDEVVHGDYSSLRAAFDRCNIEFRPSVADEFVDPELWHYK